jgi:hypothetical protein
MCIEVVGTGVDFRMTGHLRYGGKQLKARHRRYDTVAMSSEHKTSQMCSTVCHLLCVHKLKVMVKGETKTKSV